MLLEVNEALGDGGWFDAVANFHATSWHITEEIPPFWVICKSGIRDSRYEARDLEKVIYFGKIGVGKSMAGEAAEYPSGCEGTCCKDSLGHFAGWAVMSEEDDAFLSEHGINEDDDGVRIRSTCSEVGVDHEWLRRSCVRRREGLDELDDGKVPDSFRGDCCRNFDGDWYLVVHHFRFKFMCVAWYRIFWTMLHGIYFCR